MTLIKWISGFLLTLTLFILLAIIVLPRVIDPNDFRAEIVSLVKDKTGRDLTLSGDLSVSVFPWLGIKTQGLSLSQPAGIDGTMVSVQSAQLQVKLLPLLSKRVEVDTVVLEDPTVHLITLKNGVTSLDGLDGMQADEASADIDSAIASDGDDQNGSSSNAPGADKATAALAIVIQGLELTNGNVIWDDQQQGQRYDISELNLETGNLIGSELADIHASGVMLDASMPPEIRFDFTASARIDTQSLQVSAADIQGQIEQGVQEVELSIDSLTFSSQSKVVLSGLKVLAKADMSDDGAEPQLADIDAQLDGIDFDLSTQQLNASNSQLNVQAQLAEQPAIDLAAVIPALKFNVKSGEINATDVSVSGQAADRNVKMSIGELLANLDKQKADIRLVDLQSDDLKATFRDVRIRQFIDKPNVIAQLDVQPFNAAKLLNDFDIDYQASSEDVMQEIGLSTFVNASMEHLTLSKLVFDIDQSSLKGSFSANDFDNPKLKFDLSLDQLNLDDYLPADEESQNGSGDDASSVSSAQALAVPMAVFKDLHANGRFKAQRLVTGGLLMNSIDVQISSTPGTVTITPKAKLYDGSLDGAMVFSESEKQSKLSIKNSIDLVDLAGLLKATEVSEQLSGIGSLDLDIQVIEENGVQTNQGTIKLFAKNGALKGVDIKKIVDQGYQQYKQFRGKESNADQLDGEQEEQIKSDSADETRFAELLGTFTLKDNVISNDDFDMKAPLFRIQGNGKIDLANESLNYLVSLGVVNSTNGQGGEAFDNLKGISIPVRFKGSLYSPSYSLDMKSLYKSYAKQEIQDKKSEYLQEKLGIEDGGKLSTKELLKQALINKAAKKTTKRADESAPAKTISAKEETPLSSRESSEPQEPEAESAKAPPTKEELKEELKDELKRKVFEGLFGK